MTDPFRPARAAAAFPRERLLRAGLDERATDTLAASFDAMGADERAALVTYVDQHPDEAIVARYAGGIDSTATPTREQLDELTVPALEDLLRARDLPLTGRKGDLIDRLLASYAAGDDTGSSSDDGQGQTVTGTGDLTPGPAALTGTGDLTPGPAALTGDADQQQAPAPEPAPEPTAGTAEQPPATLPVGSPGAPAAAEPAATTTPAAAPAGGSTDTTGGTPA